jgi:plastocyanin
MINRRKSLAVAAACVLAFGATACSSDSGTKASSTPTTGAATSGAPVALTIQNSSFSAASVTAGTEFTIENKDTVTHTVTADDSSFDIRVPGGSTMTLTIPAAGTFKIHCKIHASMHGTITAA